jgi:hypothetical protein
MKKVSTVAAKASRKLSQQVAAPAETRTPNLHRANKSLPRVRMEGWRQWLTRPEKTLSNEKTTEPT